VAADFIFWHVVDIVWVLLLPLLYLTKFNRHEDILCFALAYLEGGPCIAEMPPDSFAGAFFFSAETLATVGYGHMHPASTYGHVVVTVELMRRFYDLKLQVESIITFPAVLTLRHTIDEASPMHGATPESLKASDARFMSSVVCMDTVIHAPLQSLHGYHASDVRFGERFVEVYSESSDGKLFVDYARIHDTEPAPTPSY